MFFAALRIYLNVVFGVAGDESVIPFFEKYSSLLTSLQASRKEFPGRTFSCIQETGDAVVFRIAVQVSLQEAAAVPGRLE